ncbi:MAG: hypothetical protein WCH62_03890 [Candidatus Omnitrophota bacterium]
MAAFFFNPFNELINSLGGKVNLNGEGVFPFQGKNISLKYTPGSRNSSPSLKLIIDGTFGANLLIRKETSLDKFYKRISLNRELQISDRDVNDKLYFECDDQEFLNYLFLNPNTKSEVFDILKDYSDIEISKNKCLFKKHPSPNISEITKEHVLLSAKELFDFSLLIPNSGGSHPELATFKIKSIILYSLGTITLATGIISMIWANISYCVVDPIRLWVWASNYSVSFALVLVSGAFFSIKGFSTSSKIFSYFFITLCLGAPLCGRYGIAVYNGFYDRSPVEEFEQVVINKYITHHKSSTYYHVVVSPWRQKMKDWSFTTNSLEYDNIQLGDTQYTISTSAGRLGFEWVLSERLTPTRKIDKLPQV